MFAHIELNGATDVYIGIPPENISYLSSLVAMLENNALFVKEDWSKREPVKAKTTIEVASTITLPADNTYGHKPEVTITMPTNPYLLDGYEEATPVAFAKFAETVQTLNDEISRQKVEIDRLNKIFLDSEKKRIQEDADGDGSL